MIESTVVHCDVTFTRRGRGGARVTGSPVLPDMGRIPRLAYLMALARHYETLLHEGLVDSYADLARLGDVTRARMTQIMNLLHLPPDVQEEILFLPSITAGRDPIRLADLQPITRLTSWDQQRRLWQQLRRQAGLRPVLQPLMRCTNTKRS